jgi:hypothetical protein
MPSVYANFFHPQENQSSKQRHGSPAGSRLDDKEIGAKKKGRYASLFRS